jgi:hypothetical protein
LEAASMLAPTLATIASLNAMPAPIIA